MQNDFMKRAFERQDEMAAEHRQITKMAKWFIAIIFSLTAITLIGLVVIAVALVLRFA